MTKNSKQREVLLSGADGFSLNETARLLGDEWGEEARHVARSLLRALKKGEFDPPPEWASFDLERLINPYIPESEKPDYGYGLQLLSDDKLTGEGIDSRSVSVFFSEEMQVGNEGDFGDRIFVPVKAIARFCALKKLPLPVFLVPAKQDKPDPVLPEDEVYRTLETIGSAWQDTVDELAKEVGRRLGRRVTKAMRGFKRAVEKARDAGIIRIAPVGRPRGEKYEPP
jgi:hypothetical protein